ncbi:TolC family protein [Panacibacter ginsenosidivorans]|uniref:TolC family protein n=1 Tax=Panacibacter ginsenosidivorans TaxID=1813871 RepID=A0A5B8VFT7_9BACT|nr:TolC family protein [Panacibacter ginsenosidivorans]QEC69416.1 TolC family protein [Panacibacter ginsenosidivorans]
MSKAIYSCRHLPVLVFFAILSVHAFAQDSLHLSIGESDKMFLQTNLMVAAGQLNVDAQKAMEIQAKLYPNPQFSVGLNAYDTDNKNFFYAGKNGEKAVTFEQLILLGGKRKNEIELSKQNTKQAELELEDMLRNLKYKLHTSLYSVYFDLQTLQKFNTQLQQLDTIIASYEIQAKKGNLPLKEVVRLKSTYIQLNNNKTELLQSIQDEQKDLQVMLQTTAFVIPAINENVWSQYESLPAIDSLQQLALKSRTDVMLATLNRSIADINVHYQKSLAVPDLTLNTAYDQRGGAFNNQFLFTVGIPLPIWNRNQGNIHYAQTQTKLAAVNEQMQQTSVSAEVNAAWYNMQRSIQEYKKTQDVYNKDFTDVYDGMRENFLKQNISIVEFVDFFESYNESLAEVNRIKKQLALSAENINYTTAYPVY